MSEPKKKRLYLAGPMRGCRLYNLKAFMEGDRSLRMLGYEVVNPLELDIVHYNFQVDMELEDQPEFSLEKAMTRDFLAILRCDGVAFLPDWRKSEGAVAEYVVAKSTGKRTYEFDEEFSGLDEIEDGYSVEVG